MMKDQETTPVVVLEFCLFRDDSAVPTDSCAAGHHPAEPAKHNTLIAQGNACMQNSGQSGTGSANSSYDSHSDAGSDYAGSDGNAEAGAKISGVSPLNVTESLEFWSKEEDTNGEEGSGVNMKKDTNTPPQSDLFAYFHDLETQDHDDEEELPSVAATRATSHTHSASSTLERSDSHLPGMACLNASSVHMSARPHSPPVTRLSHKNLYHALAKATPPIQSSSQLPTSCVSHQPSLSHYPDYLDGEPLRPSTTEQVFSGPPRVACASRSATPQSNLSKLSRKPQQHQESSSASTSRPTSPSPPPAKTSPKANVRARLPSPASSSSSSSQPQAQSKGLNGSGIRWGVTPSVVPRTQPASWNLLHTRKRDDAKPQQRSIVLKYPKAKRISQPIPGSASPPRPRSSMSNAAGRNTNTLISRVVSPLPTPRNDVLKSTEEFPAECTANDSSETKQPTHVGVGQTPHVEKPQTHANVPMPSFNSDYTWSRERQAYVPITTHQDQINIPTPAMPSWGPFSGHQRPPAPLDSINRWLSFINNKPTPSQFRRSSLSDAAPSRDPCGSRDPQLKSAFVGVPKRAGVPGGSSESHHRPDFQPLGSFIEQCNLDTLTADGSCGDVNKPAQHAYERIRSISQCSMHALHAHYPDLQLASELRVPPMIAHRMSLHPADSRPSRAAEALSGGSLIGKNSLRPEASRIRSSALSHLRTQQIQRSVEIQRQNSSQSVGGRENPRLVHVAKMQEIPTISPW